MEQIFYYENLSLHIMFLFCRLVFILVNSFVKMLFTETIQSNILYMDSEILSQLKGSFGKFFYFVSFLSGSQPASQSYSKPPVFPRICSVDFVWPELLGVIKIECGQVNCGFLHHINLKNKLICQSYFLHSYTD